MNAYSHYSTWRATVSYSCRDMLDNAQSEECITLWQNVDASAKVLKKCCQHVTLATFLDCCMMYSARASGPPHEWDLRISGKLSHIAKALSIATTCCKGAAEYLLPGEVGNRYATARCSLTPLHQIGLFRAHSSLTLDRCCGWLF